MTDWSLPLSELLKEGTAEAHDNIEHSPGAGYLTRAELDKEEYARYLMLLWYIYDSFERALTRHQSHPTLQPTYNPGLLARSQALAADIAFLLQVPEDSWKIHPIHVQLSNSPPPILTKYTRHLDALADSSDPSLLLAHSYVRYLGDLSGGQVIRRRTAKAYGLDESTGQGISFYQFRKLDSPQPAGQGDMRKIKEWYRDGLNSGVGDNVQLKQDIVKEASLAFDLSSEIFGELKPSSTPRPPIVEQLQTQSGKVIYEYVAPPQKSYPLSTFVGIIAAACLAHFILVLGGFTGQRGYAKLLQFEEWLASLLDFKSV
jgi:heme oxygenase